MLYEVITIRLQRYYFFNVESAVIAHFFDVQRLLRVIWIQINAYDFRITSYNVCYTKLLRIVKARKSDKSPCKIYKGMIIHKEDGSYSVEADKILREAGAIEEL